MSRCFFNWYPPKKLKYGKPRLGVSTLTYIGLDTPNLAYINFFVLELLGGVPVKKNTLYIDCGGIFVSGIQQNI